MTISITEFIVARLDEDVALATAAANDSYGEDCWFDTGNEHIADHYLRHGTARVLREVAAKRAILAEHAPKVTTWIEDDEPDTLSCARCGIWHEYPVPHPCLTVRHLAAPYADHPDYNHEWSTE